MPVPSWQEQGSCREVVNPETGKPFDRAERMALFFPDDDQPVDEIAVEACSFCPVLEQCREWSVSSQLFGYSGGMTERERGYARSYQNIWLKIGESGGGKGHPWNVSAIPCPSARGYKMHLKRGQKVARIEKGGCGCLEEHRKQSKASKDRSRAKRDALRAAAKTISLD
jgi:hypothetical protein